MTKFSAELLITNTTLRQLQIFETVARLGGFTRAAEELYITQPTVSMQIKRLAELVEMPMFERVGKQLHLTSAGRKVYEAAVDILGRLRRLDDEISDLKGIIKGDLRISAVFSAKYFIPHLLGAFMELYPEVMPHVVFTNRSNILKRLEENHDDLVLMGKFPEGIDVTALPFLENRLVVVAHPDCELAKQKEIDLERLLQERFIDREPGSGTQLAVDTLFKEFGLTAKPYIRLGSSEAIKQAVMAGLGFAILSCHNIRLELAHQRLKILDVKEFPLYRKWFVGYPPKKSLSLVARTFINFIVDESETILSHLEADHAPGTKVSDYLKNKKISMPKKK